MAAHPAQDLLAALAKGSGPFIIVLVGPNGAGKSTFFRRHLEATGLPFINADAIAKTLIENGAEPGEATERLAAHMADKKRAAMIARRESFITETVFSDPVGAKVDQLRAAHESGITVVLIFVCVHSAELTALRVQTRVAAGGHSVPPDKIAQRYERLRQNVKAALTFVDTALIIDNSSLDHPLNPVAATAHGKVTWSAANLPWWAQDVLPQARA